MTEACESVARPVEINRASVSTIIHLQSPQKANDEPENLTKPNSRQSRQENSPRSSEYQGTVQGSAEHLSAVEKTVISQLTALSARCSQKSQRRPSDSTMRPYAVEPVPMPIAQPQTRDTERCHGTLSFLQLQQAAEVFAVHAASNDLSQAARLQIPPTIGVGNTLDETRSEKKEQRTGAGRNMNAAQKHILKQHFVRNKKPSKDACEKIAMEVDRLDGGKPVTARVVEVWFNNRRAKKGDADTDSEDRIDPCNLQTPYFCEVRASKRRRAFIRADKWEEMGRVGRPRG